MTDGLMLSSQQWSVDKTLSRRPKLNKPTTVCLSTQRQQTTNGDVDLRLALPPGKPKRDDNLLYSSPENYACRKTHNEVPLLSLLEIMI